MKRILALILLHIVVTLLLSGCWNRRELNELAIAVAAGVDWVDDRYRLTVQVAIPGQVTSKKAEGPKLLLLCIRLKAIRSLKLLEG